MTLAPQNARLLDDFVPFVVATPDNLRRFDLSPFGVPVARTFDPLRLASAPMLERLCALDQVAFEPEGMPMPRFVFFDGGEVTGAICGLASSVHQLDPALRELLTVPPGYGGLVPVSMYVAIPDSEPGTWVGHNLSSVAARHHVDTLRGLGSLTKALALRIVRARFQIGAAQWNGIALRVHARLGALQLLSAWTPAHEKPWTFTYRATIDDAATRHLARDPAGQVTFPEPTEWLESNDHAAMRRLQTRIEAGARACVAGSPERTDGAAQRIPLAVEG